MFKKLLLCITILMCHNTKIHSTGYLIYALHNSCRPTAVLATIASAAVLAKERDKDLICPLAATVAFSTIVSGISCFLSLNFSKTIALWNCTETCSTKDLWCRDHSPEDNTITQYSLETLYKHAHRLGTFTGLAAGAGGYLLYKNYYA